jgi:phage terminase large subunit-like protein
MQGYPKIDHLLQKVTQATKTGRLLYSNHANERMSERKILKIEIEYILSTGFHEARKDQFNVKMNSWDYAIKGKTIDGKNLRIVVAIIKPNILVVTAIDLDK